jgi:hypothetical protein
MKILLLMVSAVLEAATGVVLVLGVAYWLPRNEGQSPAARGLVAAILLYNGAFAMLLAYARLGSGLSGVALWPAVLLHTALAIWCIRCLRFSPRWKGSDEPERPPGS